MAENVLKMTEEEAFRWLEKKREELGEEMFQKMLEAADKIEDGDMTASFSCPECKRKIKEPIFRFFKRDKEEVFTCPHCQGQFRMGDIKGFEYYQKNFPDMFMEAAGAIDEEIKKHHLV